MSMKNKIQTELRKLPKIGTNDETELEDIVVPLKLFNPCGAGTWYLYEYDPKDNVGFGFCKLYDPQFAELGYVSITEAIEAIEAQPFHLSLEIDLNYTPMKLKEIMDITHSGKHV